MTVHYNDFIAVYEKAASDDLCDRIIAEFERLQEVNPSGVYDNSKVYGNGAKRKDTAIFFDLYNPHLCSEVNDVLQRCLTDYLAEYPGLAEESFQSLQVKVQKTPPKGGYHLWHCEQGDGSNMNRLLVWTIYLNDVAEGQGETEFLHQALRIQPKKGSVSFFPAAWTHLHRGNLMLNQDKYIATGWYLRM